MNVYKSLMMVGIAALAVRPGSSSERKVVLPSVTPQRHAGQTYVDLGLISAMTGAPISRGANLREASIRLRVREVRLCVGSRTAFANGQKRPLSRAPYLQEGNMMVPLRLVAEALNVPVRYEEQTASLLVGPGSDHTLWSVPLETRRTGIVIHSPEPGAVFSKQVRVHGQANTPDSTVVVQLQSETGQVLQQGILPRTRGSFREFVTFLVHANSSGGTQQVRIVAFSPSPKDGTPRHQVVVPVTLHLADSEPPVPER